ncbi:hypothetical protein, partial [Mycobacterium sp.]|uniref:hypothetical protein n=1 Tax=Mycobacterium sp. TaxID=1785 RepID=UPI00261BF8DF
MTIVRDDCRQQVDVRIADAGAVTPPKSAPIYYVDVAGPTSVPGGIVLADESPMRGEAFAGDLVAVTLWHGTVVAGTTSYAYDASGNVLVRRDPGSSTLYLSDAQITQSGGTTLTGVRYYNLGGATIAERTSAGQVNDLVPDRQGTDQLAVTTTTADQTATRRQYTPFGQARGTTPTWIGGDKGYIGGDNDPTTGLETL